MGLPIIIQTDLFQSVFFILYLETLMSTPALFASFNAQLETRLNEMMNSGYPIMRLNVDNLEANS